MYNKLYTIQFTQKGAGMTLTTLEQEILLHLQTLALPRQRAVLAFVQTLIATPVGVPGKELLAFAGAIELQELTTLQQAIEADCEQVVLNEW